jgi:hypothetical protein
MVLLDRRSRHSRRFSLTAALVEGLLISSALSPAFAQQAAPVANADTALKGPRVRNSGLGPLLDLRAELYSNARSVFQRASEVHYQHEKGDSEDSQVVDTETQCKALCDCSGLVSYLLQTTSPKHYAAVKDFYARSGHPLASTYEKFFASLSSSQATRGWWGLASYKELRRGDLIAWKKPSPTPPPAGTAAPSTKKGNTGHVMIVEDVASEIQHGSANGQDFLYVNIPVIDSSSVDHFPPEQLPPKAHQNHRDGIGRGTVRLLLNDSGRPIGYWEGTYWGEGNKEIKKPSYTSDIAFARLEWD